MHTTERRRGWGKEKEGRREKDREREGRKETVHEKSLAEGLRLSWMARTWASWKRARPKFPMRC